MKQTTALLGVIGSVLLMNPSHSLAAVGDERFLGGNYDGYDSQVLIQPSDPHHVSMLFAGGSYDGYDSQTLVQPPDPHHASAVFAGGSYDGYDSQALIQSPDPHQSSAAFRGGNYDGYDSGAVVCYCFNATGLHGTFTGEPIGWYAAGATVTVTVTAVADPYYHFAGWSGETQGDTNALTMTLTMTMDQARFLLAFFAENLAPLGTPEVWLASWGWTSNFGYWETNDTDGDFFFAWQEQIADTDPTSSNSFFHLMNVGHTNSFAVTFSCTNTRVYNLEFNTNLFAAWASVSGQTNVPGAAGGSMTLTDTVDAVRRAYRVGVSENTGNPH